MIWEDARDGAMTRSGGQCEGRIMLVCSMGAAQVHHVIPRGRGGTHDLINLVALCEPCHSWVHANPVAATQRGLLGHAARSKKLRILTASTEVEC